MSGAARWQRVQQLFHDAIDLDEDSRQQFLARECADDHTLIDEVLALIDSDAESHTLLDDGVARAAHSLLADDSASLPAQRFGPYRLTGLLGEGGMGVVYRGVRDDIGAEAAIKILRDPALSPARRERFRLEQQTLARLHHPGIAQLHDADTLPDGTPWFAMELIEGMPLTEWCRVHRPPLARRLYLLRKVAEAVAHAHGLAIIHRDLKPSNILITGEGDVKLVDFGIAKQLDAGGQSADRTRTGLQLMTPAYAAPEQLRAGPIGVHTDIYALGVIGYELLTGTLPFALEGLTPAEAAGVVLDRDPARPSQLARQRSAEAVHATRSQWADLDVLILTAMQKDPARRYATVDALLRDLSHFREGEPLDARPDSLGYRAAKFFRRNRPAVLTSAVVVTILAVGTVVAGVRLARARDLAVAEAVRTQRIQQFMLSLFRGGDNEVLAADSLRVSTLLERGLREAATLESEPAVQGELLATLGGIYQQVGEFTRADSLLQLALRHQFVLDGEASPTIVRRLTALALLRADQAEYAVADSLLVQATEMARIVAQNQPDVLLAAQEGLGQVRYEQGRYDDAIALFEQTLTRHLLQDTIGVAVAGDLIHLANAHFYAGRYDTAAVLNSRAMELYRQRLGYGHPLVADALINLGAIDAQRGNYAEAEPRYRRALEIIEPWYGPDHHATASALTMLGRVLVQSERIDEGRQTLERALAIQERVHGPVHPSVASALNELATVAMNEGRYDDAEASYRRMESIYRTTHESDHWLVGIAVSNQGGVAGRRGNHPLSEQRYREAVRIFTASQGAEHVNTGIARVRLARSLLRQGRFAEALQESVLGEAIVAREMAPSSVWVTIARKDMAEIYGRLGRATDSVRVEKMLVDAAGVKGER